MAKGIRRKFRLISLDSMPTSASSGYSETPLAKKLGYQASTRVVLVGAPNDYLVMIEPLAPEVLFERTATSGTGLAHVFVTERAALAKELVVSARNSSPRLRSGCRGQRSHPSNSATAGLRRHQSLRSQPSMVGAQTRRAPRASAKECGLTFAR